MTKRECGIDRPYWARSKPANLKTTFRMNYDRAIFESIAVLSGNGRSGRHLAACDIAVICLPVIAWVANVSLGSGRLAQIIASLLVGSIFGNILPLTETSFGSAIAALLRMLCFREREFFGMHDRFIHCSPGGAKIGEFRFGSFAL
jgi:hypothetical protein